MFKKFFLALLLSTLLFFNTTAVFAISPSNDNLLKKTGAVSGYDTNVSETTISAQAGSIIRGATSLVGTIFLVLIIYAGILWMTASGNDEQVKKSVSIFRSAIIGLVIVVSSYSITAFALAAFAPPAQLTEAESDVLSRCDAAHALGSWGPGDDEAKGAGAFDIKTGDGIARSTIKSSFCVYATAAWATLSPFKAIVDLFIFDTEETGFESGQQML